jgi:transcriptional regulator with XRE-family HTH domain
MAIGDRIMTIGKRIKLLRTQQGMSIDELAAKLEKNRTTVYRYENGDIENLPLSILDPLAEALNTTPADLLGWTSKEMTSTRISDGKEESIYLSVNQTYVKHVEMWHQEFGMDPFTDEEHEKLMEYGRFLISLRKK